MAPIDSTRPAAVPARPTPGPLADAAEGLLQNLVASVQDYAILLLDVEGHIATWNTGAERLKGWTEAEIVGRHFSTFYPPEDVAAGKPEWELEEAAATGRVEDESWRVRRDGTTFWANVVITALRDETGELRGYGKVTRDLTERRAQEEALRRSRDELEQTTRELRRSNADLEQFAFSASHDLQEPLRKIASFTQMLQSRYAGQLDDRADTYMELTVSGAKRMQTLIHDLLAFARAGHGDVVMRDVELSEVLAEVRSDLSAAVEESGAAIEVGDLPRVTGDRSLLTQLFQNLIANAVKFHGGGAPQVRVTAERDGERWRVRCTDDGIGVDPAAAERIFVAFQRLHSQSEFPGTGIGLALCRKIAEFHGGEMWLDTGHAGPGTSFVLTLPAAQAAG